MSWDVVLFKNKIDLSDKTAVPEPMGQRDELITRLQAFESQIDFADKSWGVYASEGVSVEFNIGDHMIVDTIMLHVRGNGNPLDFIARLCQHFTWWALDASTGEYIDLEGPSSESWDRWRDYRDKIKGQ